MKKILPILFVMVLTLGISTAVVAFAEEKAVTYQHTKATTFEEVEKTYTSENGVVVTETLTFTSTANTKNPDGGSANLTVADLTVDSLGKDNLAGKLAVTIPSLSQAGTYRWTIKENKGNTAGVQYNTDDTIHIIVLVVYNNETHALEIANTTSYIEKIDGTKAKTLDNEFQSGTFTVAKKVTGNMANENEKFEITVTLTSDKKIGTDVTLAGETIEPDDWTEVKDDDGNVTEWTYTSTMDYSESDGAKTFSDIPVGVEVTVSENKESNKMNGYTYVSTKIGEDDFTGLTVADGTDAAIVVTNEKGASIDTGIPLDSLPYVVMLSAACVGLFLFVSGKRTM